jgi:hypothetical protein
MGISDAQWDAMSPLQQQGVYATALGVESAYYAGLAAAREEANDAADRAERELDTVIAMSEAIDGLAASITTAVKGCQIAQADSLGADIGDKVAAMNAANQRCAEAANEAVSYQQDFADGQIQAAAAAAMQFATEAANVNGATGDYIYALVEQLQAELIAACKPVEPPSPVVSPPVDLPVTPTPVAKAGMGAGIWAALIGAVVVGGYLVWKSRGA